MSKVNLPLPKQSARAKPQQPPLKLAVPPKSIDIAVPAKFTPAAVQLQY